MRGSICPPRVLSDANPGSLGEVGMKNDVSIENHQTFVDEIFDAHGWKKRGSLYKAMLEVDRKDFVKDIGSAYLDQPLQITGRGLTISQPSLVAQMIRDLKVSSGDKILDVGSGTGYTSAILAKLVGDDGHVVAVEVDPEMFEFGRNNLNKEPYKNLNITTVKVSRKQLGIPKKKFNRILVSAAAREIPQELVDQLEVSGIMVIPVNMPQDPLSQKIHIVQKVDNSGKCRISHGPIVFFVPLIY